MNVIDGVFEELEPGAVPGFILRLHATGNGFVYRAAALRARVGSVVVQGIFLAPGGEGFAGFLAEQPNADDRLFVRYGDEPELSTDVVFPPPLVG